MNTWYLIAAPAWLILVITAAARLHDLGPSHWDLRYHLRRLGLAAVGAISAIMLATPFTVDRWFYAEPTWRGAMNAWAWALVWLTTEGIPPWWDYILGVHRKTEEWAGLGWRARLRCEWRALRDSFKPRRLRQPLSGPQGPLP